MTVTYGPGTSTTGIGGDTEFTVAPKSSPPEIQAVADYVCTGSGSNPIDYLTIQQALTDHDEVVLLAGNFYVNSTIFIGTTPGVGDRKTLRFQEGAKLNCQSLALSEPAIQVNASNCSVYDPYIEGGGIQGNGIGVKVGDNALPQPNYVQIFNPEVINANIGVFFSCQTSGGTESTGDCTVHGGRFRQLVTAVHSEGFVNRVNDSFISFCDYGIRQGILRDSGRIDCTNLTINQWKFAAIDIQRGRGSSFHNLWCERTANNLLPNEVIRLGSASYTVRDINFTGTTHLHPGNAGVIEEYALRLIKCRGLRVDSLEMTDELPTTAVVRVDDFANNSDNWIGKISIGDLVPAGWNYGKVISNPENSPIAIDAFPGPVGSLPGEVIGTDWVASPQHSYTVFRFPGEDRYLAKNRAGEWAFLDADVPPTSCAFWNLLHYTVGHGVSWLFAGPQFEFLEEPTGNIDHFPFSGWHGLTFEGLGKNSTIVANWRDDSVGRINATAATRVGTVATFTFATPHGFTAGQTVYINNFTPLEFNNGTSLAGTAGSVVVATVPTTTTFTAVLGATPATNGTVMGWAGPSDPVADTEPFSFTRCPNMTMKNIEMFHGGNQDDNNSSDTIDMDGSTNTLIEHVRVRRSRARAIVFDGGDVGAVSANSRIINNELYGTPKPPTVAPSTVTATKVIQDYWYCMTWVDTQYGESPPGDYTKWTPTSTTKAAHLQFESSPVYKGTKGMTLQRLYRRSAAQPTWHRIAELPYSATEYDDGASDASILAAPAPPVLGTPTIPKEGVKLLASSRNLVSENFICGTGSHSVQIVRKGSDAASNKQANGNIVTDNFLRYGGLGTSIASVAGVFAGGGDRTKIVSNDIANPGMVGNLGYGIYIQNQDGGTAIGTMIDDNTIIDDRQSIHPHGGAGMLHGVRQFIAGAAVPPNQTSYGFNYISGQTSPTDFNDGGLNTHRPSELGHTHVGIDANVAIPRNVAGQYYAQANQVAWTTAADFVMVPNHIYGGSIFFTDPTLIDDMQLEFRTAPTVGGTKMRFVIFDAEDTNGLWSTLLYESADISVVAFTGFKSVNPNLTTVGQHRYFFCVVSDSDAAIRVVNPITSGFGSSAPATTPGKINSLDKALGTGWQTGTVGPGPAAPSYTNNVPLIFVRAST